MLRSKIFGVVVVVLGLAGAGAAAAAVGGGSSASTDVSPSTTADSTTTTTTVSQQDVTTSTLTSSATQGTERSTEGCDGQDYANHGAFVSSVAHDPDREPGDVAEAAHSACGKPLASQPGETDSEDETGTLDADAGSNESDAHGGAPNSHANPHATK